MLTGLSFRRVRGGTLLTSLIRVAGLGLLGWGISTEVRPGATGAHLAVWVLVASIVPCWLVWANFAGRWSRGQLLAVGWMALAGGAVAAFAPLGLVFVGAAAVTAAMNLEIKRAAAVAALGPTALAITQAASSGEVTGVIVGGLASASAGLILGLARRQNVEAARQEALVAVERERAEILAERNRLAREVHDVLAHTLGALTVQLEALGARLETTPGAPEFLKDGLSQTRSLAADGLVEARRAVRALRDDAEPLATQVCKLCELRGAELTIEGREREVGPEATLGLFRVVQEALTNAAKHAPGAPLQVHLDFSDETVSVSVRNGRPSQPPGPIARSGSGYGLEGIRERLRLLGGGVEAGPAGEGWRVEARLPL